MTCRQHASSLPGACSYTPPSNGGGGGGGSQPPSQPNPTVQPGWGGCGSCSSCERPGECVTSPDGQCLWNPQVCGSSGGGGPTNPPSEPTRTCGQQCSNDAMCQRGNPNSVCRSGVCVNPNCPTQTEPGANCACTSRNACGQPCGINAGLCQDGSQCGFIGLAPNTCSANESRAGGSQSPYQYCIPNNPGGGYQINHCGDMFANRLVRPNGTWAGMTQQELLIACAPPDPTPTPTPPPTPPSETCTAAAPGFSTFTHTATANNVVFNSPTYTPPAGAETIGFSFAATDGGQELEMQIQVTLEDGTTTVAFSNPRCRQEGPGWYDVCGSHTWTYYISDLNDPDPTLIRSVRFSVRRRDDNSGPDTVTISNLQWIRLGSCDTTKSGTIYLDDPANRSNFNLVTNRCDGPTTTPLQPGINSSITFTSPTHSDTQTISALGTYSATLPNLGNSYLARLNPTEDYVCTCPEGCSLSLDPSSNQSDVNFYVSQIEQSWFQVVGGDVHANATSIPDDGLIGNKVFINPIPRACEFSDSCNSFSIITNSKNNPAGLLTFRGGVLDTSNESGEQRDQITEGSGTRYGVSLFSTAFNSYQKFYQWSRLGFNQPYDAFNGAKPTGKTTWYIPGGSMINQEWSLNSTEKLVVVVDGDLHFGPNAKTRVEEGGFLGFIVSGSISFDKNIGQLSPESTEAVMEGFFFAEGTVTIHGESEEDVSDKKFVLEGSLIGWQGVVFDRDFNTIDNNTNPAIRISYRPDLILNAPDSLKYSRTFWRTIAP